jgi:hypothetical protein
MDSEQLVCLPTGSVVTVVAGEVASGNYDILSRRVLVRHRAVDSASGDEKITEGWASIQSSEGYVILSPLLSLCYTNTRWGSTRPIVRQCGHAAHLNCVEAHTLSLHQRAAGDQPYDGRFAANIKDGEFLCPFCKQLSNTLIPRGSCSLETSPLPAPASSKTMKPSSTLRDVLAPKISLPMSYGISSDEQMALQQFGRHLLAGVEVPWERASVAKKRRQRQWHPELHKWDCEDSGGILRLLRQQHVAWASVGHSAAASEAAARGIEEVLPFGIFPKTADPWIDYDAKTRDSHPMLLELRRTLNATSGLYDVLLLEMERSYHSTGIDRGPVRPIMGVLLANILDGHCLASQAGSPDVWSQLTALMTSMPCHVARDGTISQRHEARATAAEMWTIRGLGTNSRPDSAVMNDTPPGNPPMPFAVKRLRDEQGGNMDDIPSNWGTMGPFISQQEQELHIHLYRPAVASAFLYVPFLAWDLNTLAGAIFSTMLASSSSSLPCRRDLVSAASILLMGRMIQAITTPCGYEESSGLDENEFLETWPKEDLDKEKAALARIVSHCRHVVKSRSLDLSVIGDAEPAKADPLALFDAIGRAILPFARSLLLILRASDSILRQRSKDASGEPESITSHQDDAALDSLLINEKIMSCEDGLLILKELGGPLPSHFTTMTPSCTEGDSAWALMNRWIVAALNLEFHHGSRGHSTLPRPSSTEREQDSKRRRSSADSAVAPVATSGEADMESPDSAGSQSLQDSEEDEDMEEMEENGRLREQAVGLLRFMNEHEQFMVDADEEESEEEMVELDVVMDEAEEMVDNALGIFVDGAAEAYDGVSDEYSSSSEGGEAETRYDQTFASVSRSPIVPYQPSLLGFAQVGEGKRGASFEYGTASAIMCDLSHLGMIHRRGKIRVGCRSWSFFDFRLDLCLLISLLFQNLRDP